MYASYHYTGNENIPAHVTVNGHTTPVWIQQKWESGAYAEYIRKNGCGHCCTAMALNLHGVTVDPHEEFELCMHLWGKPQPDEPHCQEHYASVSGIVKIMAHFGIPAQYSGVPKGGSADAAVAIEAHLHAGRQVILWSSPQRFPDNPFSPGSHYILAVGFTPDGQILIANSSARAVTADGIQLTDRETLSRALFEGSAPLDCTWGRRPLPLSGGYAVIG